ncbi:MAG: hypothetical protein QXG65_01145 [Thermoplasmata archaeon]
MVVNRVEYVALRSVHPTWLTMQLPDDAAALLRYRAPTPQSGVDRTGSISFLARGPGIARVVASHLAKEALALEQVRDRFLANARPGDRRLFSVPSALLEHLSLEVHVAGPRGGRRTDDQVLWFLPAPEYYAYRAAESSGTEWTGPSIGGMAHLYVAKAVLPSTRALGALQEMEGAIEGDEWPSGIAALARSARTGARA